MKTNLVTASVLLGATLLAAASPSGGTDQNRTVSVRTVVHTHDAASPGKPAPGPSGLAKEYMAIPDGGPAARARIVRTPKAGAEK